MCNVCGVSNACTVSEMFPRYCMRNDFVFLGRKLKSFGGWMGEGGGGPRVFFNIYVNTRFEFLRDEDLFCMNIRPKMSKVLTNNMIF